MKKNSKEAKFFCESCGSEVPRQAKTCPICGKFFASVRCPKCGKIGTNDDFKNGCPDCGYAVSKETKIHYTQPQNLKIKDSFFFEYEKPQKYKPSTSFGAKTARRRGDSQIPIWIPLVCIGVLASVLVGLYSCL